MIVRPPGVENLATRLAAAFVRPPAHSFRGPGGHRPAQSLRGTAKILDVVRSHGEAIFFKAASRLRTATHVPIAIEGPFWKRRTSKGVSLALRAASQVNEKTRRALSCPRGSNQCSREHRSALSPRVTQSLAPLPISPDGQFMRDGRLPLGSCSATMGWSIGRTIVAPACNAAARHLAQRREHRRCSACNACRWAPAFSRYGPL